MGKRTVKACWPVFVARAEWEGDRERERAENVNEMLEIQDLWALFGETHARHGFLGERKK